MSEDVKPKLYYVYKGRAYEIYNGRSRLEDVLAPIDKFNMKTIELEPTLQLMKEMGDALEFYSNKTKLDCGEMASVKLEKYRKFLEWIEK